MHQSPRSLAIAGAVITLLGAFVIVRSISASQGDAGSILASGTVEATQAELGFQLSGRLESLVVREGDSVVKGAELAALERSELLAEREVARAQVAAAQALLDEYVAGSRREEIGRARAVLAVALERRDAAQREVARLAPLAEQSLVSRQAYDAQRTELGVSQAEVARAQQELRLLETGTRRERIAAQRAALAQAQATVARIDALLGQAVLHAPFSGIVTVKHREAGEALQPGTPVLTVRNLDDRWVRLYVPGDEVGNLSLGQVATITADADPEQEYQGTISYIASVAEFTPRNVQSTKDRVKLVYEVRVRIAGDEQLALKPGLPADVRFAPAPAPAGR